MGECGEVLDGGGAVAGVFVILAVGCFFCVHVLLVGTMLLRSVMWFVFVPYRYSTIYEGPAEQVKWYTQLELYLILSVI